MLVLIDEIMGWRAGLDELLARFAHRFGRAEPRRQALTYLVGLLSPLASKNGWTLAEAAGDATPDRMQRLFNRSAWDPDAVRDDLFAYVSEHLGHDDGVLIVDETGFLKKGIKSAGVQRQYSGTAGRTENCQLGVFLAYASPAGRTLIDRELCLPRGWCDDPARREEAGIAAGVGFATKPALGLRMLERAITAGLSTRWSLRTRPTDRTPSSGPGCSSTGWAMSLPCPETSESRPRRGTPAPTSSPPARQPWPGLEASQLRRRRQRTTTLRLGGGFPARHRRRSRPRSLAADPPQHYQPHGPGLLPVLRPRRHPGRDPDPGRRKPAGRSRNASKPRRPRSDWITIRCVATTPGTAI